MKFYIEIEETLRRRILVEAENEAEALRSVRRLYDEEEVVLGAADFVGEASFRCVEEV